MKVLGHLAFLGMDRSWRYCKIGWIEDSLGLRTWVVRFLTYTTYSWMSSIVGLMTCDMGILVSRWILNAKPRLALCICFSVIFPRYLF